HDKLPPSINYAGPNPYIDFDAAHLRVLDTVSDWPRYGGYAVAGVSSFGFGGANAHVVLREVLPRDVVEREPEPQPETEPVAAAPEAHAELVGGVRFDEYGEFIDSAEVDTTPADDEYELPGITDEAVRLKEIALEELAAEEVPGAVVPLPISEIGRAH